MLNRYKVKSLIGKRAQTDVYNALNPDHAAQLATEHLRTSYPLCQTKIIKIEYLGTSKREDV
ncbi:uncharacterized protein METZ01_LOCUS159827 [marine metagenome]|uniref:Uncharacterized protein n=1 Tax=marine metagenome TaxID=408172 RepID=A0A382B136_9ZZZZ